MRFFTPTNPPAQAAFLLTALIGAAAATWGHRVTSAPAFYAGVVVLCAALGPLAFAAGRGRWPAPLLRLCSVLTLCLVALLAIELCWAAALAVKQAQPAPAPRPVFSYADARADPEGFRRWWRGHAQAFRSRSFIAEDPRGLNPFTLQPGSSTLLHESRVHINALGFRGREISQDKGDAFRIVALGESTTFGYTLAASDRPWPVVLERLIREELSCEAPVEVVNGGVPGWTIENQMLRLDREVLPLSPDLVISYHGYNGFQYFFPELPSMLVQDPPREAVRPSRLLASLESYVVRRRFLSRYVAARELARSVPVVDLQSSGYARSYRRLARQLATRGIPLAVATFNMAVDDESPEDVVRFYEQTFPDIRARMLANRMHTRLVLSIPLGKNVLPVDTRAGLDGAYEHLYIDAAHLTQAGRDRLARNLLEGLREHLLRSPRMRCNAKQRS